MFFLSFSSNGVKMLQHIYTWTQNECNATVWCHSFPSAATFSPDLRDEHHLNHAANSSEGGLSGHYHLSL